MPDSITISNLLALEHQVIPMLKQIGVAILIFLAFLILSKVFAKDLFRLLVRLSKNTPTNLDDYLVSAFEKPLQFLIVFFGAYLAFKYLPLDAQQDLLLLKLFRSSLIIIITIGFYNLAGSYEIIGKGIGNLFGIQFEKILIPFLSKTLRVILVALGVTAIAGEWNYDINGFVAGLGLGGLAFALAAKDTIANIFGGFVIITDKPFNIGDWIQTPNIEGTVEDINFRSTRIRTFAQALITVPNSTLANEPITNWSRMGKRRISFRLRVNYNTPKESLQRCINGIRAMLEGHPEISKDTIFVSFDAFGTDGFEIFFYFFTKTIVWGEHLKVKEDVNYRIMDILEGEGVSVALPSTSVYLESYSESKREHDFY